ncbi:MAG: 1-(5-phosphoribosyl)-5-[(5-phosphoribosylamino)methylideneamino]imidazole-4-carboxamide isomerase [Pelagibacteraceae bacterium]|jgi:phosphoribosylformimino-5-aminoimidazole carboxamide ribotide isomerase|nr:1-(5-phosphoribosyl)-5-[(5-phosphoribosylamino)methylideneamino]imidazole-4-carboxamide isomerase [Pseudomonadota bacterium]NCW79284.1 1-(5-phosphoribosyl)-5-[(5-phosphoribosylamino)methylideneamino]imidazole-4-carboxamide isomerase [Pelagibacteraceae bacterium]
MIIYPAIDLKNKKCVRLYKGDFAKEEIFNDSPLDQAQQFEKLGFKNLHIVDLDRTLDSKTSNLNSIKEIAKHTSLKIQVGGGLRTSKDIEEVLDLGVENIVMGTAAVTNTELLKMISTKHPMKISVGMDVRKGFLALKGWTDQTKLLAADFLEQIKTYPIKSIIFTDIDKDGTKQGVNLEETLKLASLSTVPVIASGGVANLEDIVSIQKTNIIKGVIVGKAIYDGSINLEELVKII